MSSTIMRKAHQSIVFSFKATPELKRQIKAVARSQRKSASAFVKDAIAAQLLQVQKK